MRVFQIKTTLTLETLAIICINFREAHLHWPINEMETLQKHWELIYLYYNITIYIISKEDKLEAVRHSFLGEICVHDSAFNIDSGQVSDESANSH